MDHPLPLFIHEPRTEQEVVCLLIASLPFLEPQLVIKRVQVGFPDCTVVNSETGAETHFEFELYGSHFWQHGHCPEGCDEVVCWTDNINKRPPGLRVTELRKEVKERCAWLIRDWDAMERDPGVPWNMDAFFADSEREGIDPSDALRIRQIIDFAHAQGFGPSWLTNPRGLFSVGDHEQFFKVWSNGHIGFPFFRLNCGDLFPQLIERLNATLIPPLFSLDDVRSKAKGRSISEMWPDDAQFQQFLNVWAWLAEHRSAAATK